MKSHLLSVNLMMRKKVGRRLKEMANKEDLITFYYFRYLVGQLTEKIKLGSEVKFLCTQIEFK